MRPSERIPGVRGSSEGEVLFAPYTTFKVMSVLTEQTNKLGLFKTLYHFDSIFLIPVTVFPTRFPHRNSEKRHYETNIIPYFATFENSWEKLIIRANFWVIRGLTASHDPKICTHCECFPHSFS